MSPIKSPAGPYLSLRDPATRSQLFLRTLTPAIRAGQPRAGGSLTRWKRSISSKRRISSACTRKNCGSAPSAVSFRAPR